MDLTHNFTPGTRAVAEQVNQNFADVKSAVDPLQTDVADIKTQLTSGIILPDGSVDFTRLQSYKSYTVSNATNATPIVVTAVAHDFITGDKVYISGVGGNTAANGVFTITKIGTDTFSLDGSVGNGTFSSNGNVIIYPNTNNNLPNKIFTVTNEINNLGTVTAETTLVTGNVTLADFSGAVNLVMPSNLPTGVEHIGVVNFTTTLTSSPTILQTTTTKTITGATNASPIVITATAHGYITGDKVQIADVLGNTNANGSWVITKLTDNTFSLNNSSGNATYTSGGTTRKANFKWSDKNIGKVPTTYSIISGVRNILIFKTHDGGSNWEAEYTTYGGVETLFIQPVLTANGTLGGSNFAVYCDSPVSGYDAYNSFDGNVSTTAALSSIGHYLSFYNPNALKVSSLLMTNWSDGSSILGYSIYGSNDNSIWTLLTSGTNGVTTTTGTWDIPVNSSNFYKYYKIYVSSAQNPAPTVRQIDISATYIAI